jgi:hypothetical protein
VSLFISSFPFLSICAVHFYFILLISILIFPVLFCSIALSLRSLLTILHLKLEDTWFKLCPGYWVYWQDFCGFPQFFQVNSGLEPWNA